MADPVYRFLPWARRGLAHGIVGSDGGAALPSRPPMAVALDAGGGTATAQLQLYGPGDITGIDRRVVLRSEPAPGTTDFEPNYMASVEFDPPDFPWMFTPAQHRTDRLRPWCVLVVVERRDGVSVSLRPTAPLPVLTIASPADAGRELPDLRDSWAWAHGQILEEVGSTPSPDLDIDPDRNLSRLLCPRRLRAETRYLAAVVPAFDQGVQRGLGQDVVGNQVRPAWNVATIGEIELPMYHYWEFATGAEGDVEELARRLHGPERAPTNLGRRRVYAAAAHPDVAAPPLPAAARAITMHGALRPTSTLPASEQAGALTDRLAAVVARRNTPELPPPLYGEWPAAIHELPDGTGWFPELNTEVANRVAAALGTEVVRRNQEAFVQAAWEQVGDIRRANALAGRARLASAVLDRLVERHVAPLPADRLLQLAGPVLAAVATTAPAAGTTPVTMAAALGDSSVPTGAASAAYRRLASGQRQALKRAARAGGLAHRDGIIAITAGAGGADAVDPLPDAPDGIVGLRDRSKLVASGSGPTAPVSLAPLGLPGQTTRADLDRLVPVAGPVPGIPGGSQAYFAPAQLPAVIGALTGRQARPSPVADPAATRDFNVALAAAARPLNRTPRPASFVGADVGALRARLVERLGPVTSVARRVDTMITCSRPVDPYRGVMAFPVLPEPVYAYLDRLPGSWMLPAAEGLEPDTAVLLQTNPAFTSAFLVGINHEMNSELLWRGYPTDQRGTPFQHFWQRADRRVDILPIHTWPTTKPLATAGSPPGFGTSAGGSGAQIVLLVRGQLLRRYPDMVIYATPGTRTKPGTTVPAAGQPQFFARLEPDIYLIGFPLTPAELAAAEWWFVLEQQLTAARFGLDTGSPTANSWANATWEAIRVDPGEHIVVAAVPPIGGLSIGATADVIASRTLQRPVRVAIHRDRLLLAAPGGTG